MRKQSGLDLDAVAAFAAVVDHHGFSEAARSLGLGRSVVSKRVARLEANAGVRLLQRTTRRVRLTEAGALLYARCSRVLGALADAEDELAELRGAPRGTLRVSVPVTLGTRHVAPLVPAFLGAFPDLKLEMVLADRFVNLVDEGIDVAVRVAARLDDASLVAKKLGSVATVTAGSPAYLARRGIPATPEDLLGHECLRYANVSARSEWVYRGKRGAALHVPVAGRLLVNDGAAITELAIAGVGLAKLPMFYAAEHLASRALVTVLDAYRPPDTSVFVVHPSGRAPQPKVRAFVDWLVRAMAPRLAPLASS